MPEADLLLTKIQSIYSEPRASKLEKVQTLWSGYGEISRYSLPRQQRFCIVKHINVLTNEKHPRGWNTEFSHQRKLASYQNEQQFYAQLAKYCSDDCRVPLLVDSGNTNSEIWIVMEDLDAAGFDVRHMVAELPIVKQCIRWLAHFHALFINKDISCVWPIGTYWFLDTRPDEWQIMPDSPLKNAAKPINKKLNSARYQTLLHGDAKLANFCFSANTDSVAAVDFQYTGRGCGVKDLVYLLGSCLSNEQLHQHTPSLINEYFNLLNFCLADALSSTEVRNLEAEWRGLIPYAWADFERFLLGWSPRHKKLNSYSHEQTELALRSLKEL